MMYLDPNDYADMTSNPQESYFSVSKFLKSILLLEHPADLNLPTLRAWGVGAGFKVHASQMPG